MSAYVTNLVVKRILSLAVQRMCSRKYYILLVVPVEEGVSISTDYFLFPTELKFTLLLHKILLARHLLNY